MNFTQTTTKIATSSLSSPQTITKNKYSFFSSLYEGAKPPPLTTQMVTTLVVRLFPQIINGYIIEEIKELNSYDDRNFLITTSSNICANDDPSVKTTIHYVLKITNSVDTAAFGVIEGQNEMMLHLKRHGFSVPVPLKSVFNNSLCIREKILALKDGIEQYDEVEEQKENDQVILSTFL